LNLFVVCDRGKSFGSLCRFFHNTRRRRRISQPQIDRQPGPCKLFICAVLLSWRFHWHHHQRLCLYVCPLVRNCSLRYFDSGDSTVGQHHRNAQRKLAAAVAKPQKFNALSKSRVLMIQIPILFISSRPWG